MGVQIVTDTTAGLSKEYIQSHNLDVLPQIVIFGEDAYKDDSELDTATFLYKLKHNALLPKTAAPPPALYYPIFKRHTSLGHSVIVIAPTAEASGTVRSALTALQEFPDANIHVFDSRTLAGPMATMVMRAVEWAEAGIDAQTILHRLGDMVQRQRVYFLVPTLEYLYKGGRIGGAQALIGSLLQVKPILTIREGRVEPLETQRTHRKALMRLEELVLTDYPKVRNGGNVDRGQLSVMHADAEVEAKILAAELEKKLDIVNVPIFLLPPAVVVHAGPGVLAVAYFV